MGNLRNNDQQAQAALESLYDETPKSVLALVAFHFAQRIADDFTDTGARRAIAQEIVTLAENGLVTATQARAARRLLETYASAENRNP